MREEVLERLQGTKDLPTLPAVASEIIALGQSSDISIKDLSDIIHRDPPLAAKVLKVANAPYYRCAVKEIDTLQKAITFLGMDELINIVTSISFFSAFSRTSDGIIFRRDQFWNHCVATGIIARSFAKELRSKTAGRDFVGGLLHDIGKILLDAYFHENFVDAYNYSITKSCPSFIAEAEVFGITHMEVGYLLAKEWALPEYLTDIILHHHDPERAKFKDKDIVAIVSLADLLSKAQVYAYGGDTMSFVLSDQGGWRVLSNSGYPVDKLDLERFSFSMGDMGDSVNSYISTAAGRPG